jgi:anion-transporting  ArsA/GET3 family ATPase
MEISRLYMVTGKGGVGKTTFSLALTRALQDRPWGKKIKLVSFTNDQHADLAHKLQLQFELLDPLVSVTQYLSRKLSSRLVAEWIVKTDFFQSIFDLVPGFSYLIILGHLVDQLQTDPDLYIVLDSPASGHAVNMLSSLKIFEDIFQSGPMYKDILKTKKALIEENFFSIVIVTLAGILPLQESFELQDQIEQIVKGKSQIIVNGVMSNIKEKLERIKDYIPPFLLKKCQIEQNYLLQYQHKFSQQLSFFYEDSEIHLIEHLIQQLKEKHFFSLS